MWSPHRRRARRRCSAWTSPGLAATRSSSRRRRFRPTSSRSGSATSSRCGRREDTDSAGRTNLCRSSSASSSAVRTRSAASNSTASRLWTSSGSRPAERAKYSATSSTSSPCLLPSGWRASSTSATSTDSAPNSIPRTCARRRAEVYDGSRRSARSAWTTVSILTGERVRRSGRFTSLSARRSRRGWMKKWSSAIIVVTAVLLGVAVSPVVAQAPGPTPSPAPASGSAIRIAYIDVQRVLARSSAGVAAREQLEREKAVMQREMEGKRQELEKLRDELEKKGALMTPDARRERQEQFERKRRDAARQMDDFQKELEKKEQTLLQRVLQELSGVIERVGKERGYYLVVEKRGASVLYASPDADLTDEIIRAYDQQAPKKSP